MKGVNSKHGAFIVEAEQAHAGYCVVQYKPLLSNSWFQKTYKLAFFPHILLSLVPFTTVPLPQRGPLTF